VSMKISLSQIRSVSELQRHYRKVVQEAKKAPVVITSNNKPEVAIVNIEYLDKLEKIRRDWEIADTLDAIKVANEAERNGELIQADSVLELLN